MIEIDSFGGKIGNIQWQNTWNELWGHTGFWEKNPGEKGRFTLWGIRPHHKNTGETGTRTLYRGTRCRTIHSYTQKT